MCKPCQLSPEIAVEMKDMVWRMAAPASVGEHISDQLQRAAQRLGATDN